MKKNGGVSEHLKNSIDGKKLITFDKKKGGFNLSHLKNSIDGKMVGSVAVVVSVNGSTCHRVLKVDHDHAGRP